MVYSPFNVSSDELAEHSEFDGTLYFTRPGTYRLEWLLSGDDFPIEGGQGYPKLVVEVEVEWPDAASFDYRHIAETPDVPLDPSTTDTVAFKELLLTQRYKGSVPDFSVVDDVKIKDQNKFSFPTWSDGQQSGITYRSVLLFTRTRTDTSEVTKEGIIRAATGNLDNEEVVIKIVESHHWAQSDVLSEKSIDIGAEIKEGSDIHSSEVKHNGYVMQNGLENARYNGLTYQPNTMTGEIFAVNQESKAQTVVNGKTAAQDGSDDLVVAWYKHYSDDGGINWPHLSVRYSPKWPDKKAISRIVVASRLGTDGLSATDAIIDPSKRQFKFDPARYTDVKVYNQPDKTKPGYNPNEEHALVMPSFFYSSEKPQPKAAFALRNDLNQKDNNEDSYTSDPFVLVQYKDKVTDKFGMQTYHIQYEDEETSDTHAIFEVDTSGDGNKDTDGSFKYTFEYPTLAGDLVKAPYPLESIIGAVKVNEIYGRNPEDGKNVYWKDKGGNSWAISGNDGSEFYITFWYPLSDNFWHPTAVSGEIVPFVKNSLQTEEAFTEKSKRQSPYFVSDANVVNYQYFTQQMVGDPRKISDNLTVKYNAYWKPDIPEIRIGETLTFQGGEEKKDDDSISGLPAVIGWKSAELLYDSENDSGEVGKWVDLEGGTAQSSARIQPAVREIRVPLSTEYFPSDLEKSEQTDGWFLKGLNAGLKQRVYYDNKSGHLVLRGILNGRFRRRSSTDRIPRDV